MPNSRFERQPRTVALGLMVAGAVVISIGCGDRRITERVTSTVDCQEVCQSYADCVGEDYDVSGCRERCANNASRDDTWDDRLSTCNSCLDDSPCAGSTLDCSGDCSGIVP